MKEIHSWVSENINAFKAISLSSKRQFFRCSVKIEQRSILLWERVRKVVR